MSHHIHIDRNKLKQIGGPLLAEALVPGLGMWIALGNFIKKRRGQKHHHKATGDEQSKNFTTMDNLEKAANGGLGGSFNATGAQPGTIGGMPTGATVEGDHAVNVHPVSVELKHILVFGFLFFIGGLGLGYWEMKKTEGDWKVITGFATAGLIIGVAIGFALPARKKHKMMSATGKEECCFTEA